MYELTQMKNRKYILFIQNEKRQRIFNDIKKRMMMTSIVAYPDFKKSFILYMNAFRKGIGMILHQKDDQGKEYIIAYVSKAFN